MARPKPVVRVLRPPPPEPPPEPAPEEVEGFIRDGRRPQASADVRERPQASVGIRRRSPKSLVTRDDGRQVYRLTVYLTPETTDALDAHLAVEGGETSRAIELALQAWLRDRGR